ncbi:MAG: ABC transporter substrate-binding protein [Kineosporiaceae bacterium]
MDHDHHPDHHPDHHGRPGHPHHGHRPRHVTRRTALGLFGLAGATATLAACSGDAAAPAASGGATGTGTLRLGTNWPFVTFDAHDAIRAGAAGANYWRPALDCLVHEDGEGRLTPGLAESWEMTAERIVLGLREGLLFHDGSACDAEAVVANLERARADTLTQPGFRTVTAITAADARTVEIALSAPAPLLPRLLSANAGMMISPAMFDQEDVARRPVGTGGWEYQQGESVEGQRYVYTRFADYWDPDSVLVDRLELVQLVDASARLNAVLSGQVDLTAFDSAQALQADRDPLSLVGRPGQRFTVAVLDRDGTTVPAFARAEARAALGWALDREALVEGVMGGLGTPATSFVLPDQDGYDAANDEIYGYDPDRARSLLAEAGFADGFSFPFPSIPAFQRVIEAVVEQWAEVGIRATIEPLDPSQYGPATQRGEYPIFLSPFFGGDMQEPMERFVGPTASTNPFQVDDGPAAEALAELQRTLDPDERDRVTAETVGLVLEQGILIPCFVGDQTAVVRDGVEGVAWTYANDLAPQPYGVAVGG